MINVTRKIKAFTLTEVMVVIVISAIVAGLAFSILNIVQGNMRNIEENYEYQSYLQSFEVALTIDFNKYSTVEWNPREDRLIFSSPIHKKSYRFLADSIVSETNTYHIKTKSKSLYREGTSVPSGKIDAIKLTFDNTTDLHRIFVFKYNDPTIYFEYGN